MPVLKEHVTEERAVRYALLHGYLVFKLNALGARGKPDRLFVSPDGKHIYIEFKRLGEDLRLLQKFWAWELRRRKCIVYRCDNYDDAELILKTHLDPEAVPVASLVINDEAGFGRPADGSRSGENLDLLDGIQDSEGKAASS